jgi:endo-1,3(4)-beta-glucanase
MFPFGNGKSQESSSEAVNGYYGAYLWSLVRHGAANDPLSDTSIQTDFARLLLATEIRGAKLYWHMMPPNSSSTTESAPSVSPVYPPEFSKNYMIGNIGMLDALCSTWFGNEELYVHMINFIPVTSATGELFSSNYIEQEYTTTLKPLGDVEMAWRGYVVADHAIIAPNTAWKEAEQLESAMLDSALSKTQVLFWIATRSGFKAAAISPESTQSPTSPIHIREATCSSYPSCSKLGLIGDCCPTSQGSFLECCQ